VNGSTTGVRVQLDLLGGFGLHCGGEPVAVPPAGRRLLAYLAVHRRPSGRGVVAATLWPDGTDAQAGANLRSALRRLPRPEGLALVTAGPTHLRLPPWGRRRPLAGSGVAADAVAGWSC
jgi:DNA-binding SARP family transcriptional activator